MISIIIVNKVQRHPSFENASLRKVLRPLEAPSEHQMATTLFYTFSLNREGKLDPLFSITYLARQTRQILSNKITTSYLIGYPDAR